MSSEGFSCQAMLGEENQRISHFSHQALVSLCRLFAFTFHLPVESHILEKKKKGGGENTQLNALKGRERSRRGIFSDIFLSQNLPDRNTKGISRKDFQLVWKHFMEGGKRAAKIYLKTLWSLECLCVFHLYSIFCSGAQAWLVLHPLPPGSFMVKMG